MSDINLSIPSVPAVSLSVSASAPSLSLATLGAQGPRGEVEGTAISQLMELLSLNDDDLLVIVDDPAGDPVTKSVKLSTLKTYFNS